MACNTLRAVTVAAAAPDILNTGSAFSSPAEPTEQQMLCTTAAENGRDAGKELTAVLNQAMTWTIAISGFHRRQ